MSRGPPTSAASPCCARAAATNAANVSPVATTIAHSRPATDISIPLRRERMHRAQRLSLIRADCGARTDAVAPIAQRLAVRQSNQEKLCEILSAPRRMHLHHDLIAGHDGLRAPSLADQRARAIHFHGPHCLLALRAFDNHLQEGVRVGPLEFLHRSFQLEGLLTVEHREGMMRGSRDCEHAEQYGGEPRYVHAHDSLLASMISSRFDSLNIGLELCCSPLALLTPQQSSQSALVAQGDMDIGKAMR